MPDDDAREVPGRPDLFVGQRCWLDPGQYPDDERRFKVVAVRATRVFAGGWAVAVRADGADPKSKPREFSPVHLQTDGTVRPVPDWREYDIGGHARNLNGLWSRR